MNGDIWVVSTRDPDGKPVCEIRWDGERWYAPVASIRIVAIDLVMCAAYAEIMMELASLDLPAAVVSGFMSSVLSKSGRKRFGTGRPKTIDLLPAGSTKRREALVLLRHGGSEEWEGSLTPTEAREMALAWLEAAEATESDQLVAEALRATGATDEATTEKLFGYLRELRAR